jgi:hypothetical protein
MAGMEIPIVVGRPVKVQRLANQLGDLVWIWWNPASANTVPSNCASERYDMPTLRIQHAVPNFEGWKRAFDSDPADRKGSGVRRYSVSRSVEDPNLVMIDLDFDAVEDARGLLAKMERIWLGPGKDVMQNPVAWIVETVETIDL